MGCARQCCIRINVKVRVVPFRKMEKWESTLNQTEPSGNIMLTHEPWAWDKSVVGRAHELMRTDPIRKRNVDVTGVLQFPFILTAVN